MTRQKHDQFLFQGREFSISAFTGEGVFLPSDFDLETYAMGMGCNRGYLCRYEVADGFLWLRKLSIRLNEPREVLGGLPRLCYGVYVYERLPDPLPFTGGLLIGSRNTYNPGLIRSRFRRAGITMPFQLFGEFFEIGFADGRVANESDKSNAVEALRMRLAEEKWRPTRRELAAWVDATFEFRGYHDYEMSLYS